MKEEYKNPFGTWEVTTEGDVEGRSRKNLGTHTGNVDDIALHLADKCYYVLNFKKVEITQEFVTKRKEVNISFDYGAVDIKNDLDEVREVFSERPVSIEIGQYYNAIKITSTEDVGTAVSVKEVDKHGFVFGF